MKNLIIVVLLAAGIVLGGLYLRQAGKTSELQARVASLDGQLKAKEAEAAKSDAAEKKVKELKSRLSQSSVAAAEKSSQVAALQEKLASAKTNSDAKGLGAMFKSPDMREMIRNQQKMFLGPMVEKSYSSFFQQLNLNDEQKGYLKDLLQKKMLGAADSGVEMLSADPDKREELLAKIKDETAAYDKQIKDYLGDSYYPQFQAYEKTVGDRVQLAQFKDQLTGSQNALTPEQEQQLVQAMSEERANFKWSVDFNDKTKMQANMAKIQNEDTMNKLADDLNQFSGKVLPRAQQLLSADQYTAFESFLKASSQMQVTQLKIAAQMFAPKGK